MLVLGIETSTPVCSVALVEDDVVCASYTLALGIHHSEHLFPMIERVLADRGVELSDLDGIAVASGPGSFTGLRIGMASAKALCLASQLPLVGISTLAGLAYAVACGHLPVCAMLDARRQQVYMGLYADEAGQFAPLVGDCAISIDGAIEKLPEHVLLVGDGAWAHEDAIRAKVADGALFTHAQLGRPHAGSIALLGMAALKRGEKMDLDAFEPQYLRASQAEQVRAARLAQDQSQ